MPKLKAIETCKHPNSRKTKALSKELKKKTLKEKLKLQQNIKQNLIGEKLLWFKSEMTDNFTTCSIQQAECLIKKYLNRFNDELEQIKMKHSIGNRKNRQHASREDIINMTIKREKDEFTSCGLELPDLFNHHQMEMLKNWNGEIRLLSNFKLKRIGKKHLHAETIKNHVEMEVA